jgi:hypothetical protein
MPAPTWSQIRWFKPAEFDEPDEMDGLLVRRLDATRTLAKVPMVVTSSYRTGDDLSHGRGFAVDVSDNAAGRNVSSRWRIAVVRAALTIGFSRIGIYDRHIHLDCDPSLPQEVLWVGASK